MLQMFGLSADALKCTINKAMIEGEYMIVRPEHTTTGAAGEAQPTRVALIGIVVENPQAVPKMNELLHEYAHYVIGRMGIPYEKRGVSIISVAVDAPADVISALSGKIGRLEGISTKTIYSKLPENET